MNEISEEALRRFKRIDPDEILNDAQQRLGDISVETRQKWQEGLYHETNGHRELDELRRYMSSRAALMASGLESHQKYLASHNDDKFTLQEIQEHNKHMDETSLYLSFLADEIAKFPPLPVLPPSAPLIKVSGIIEEVEFTKAMACFDAEVYSTVRDELERKRQRDNIGALVAMTAQVLSGAPPHAMIYDGRLKKQKCLYVKGKIDGKTFSGWFGMTNIRPGDRVEMAAMPEGDGYLAYAIANPEQRTISFTPKCNSNGRMYSLSLSLLGCFVILFIPFILISLLADGEAFWWVLFWYGVLATALGISIFRSTKKEHGVHFILYRQIARALEFPGGEKYSLRTVNMQRRKDNTWVPRKGNNVPMPQNPINEYFDEYFYYY